MVTQLLLCMVSSVENNTKENIPIQPHVVNELARCHIH